MGGANSKQEGFDRIVQLTVLKFASKAYMCLLNVGL